MIAERAGMRQRHDGIFEWGLGRTEAKRAADRAVRAGAGRARQDDKHRCPEVPGPCRLLRRCGGHRVIHNEVERERKEQGQ